MGFSDFWRGERSRERDERERDRWRTAGEERGGERDYGGRDYEMQDEDFERRGWRQGGDYYRPERSGAGGYGAYGSREQAYGRQDYGRGRMYGGSRSFNDRWQESYGREGPGEMSGQSRYRGSPGEGYGQSYGGGYGMGRLGSESVRGSFRGLGPRGYRRSDERIREDVCECLTFDDQIDASEIEVIVLDGEVTLSGSVSSREDKRRAEDMAQDVSGVKDVHNTLRVSNEGTTQGRQASSTQSSTTQSGQSGQTGQTGQSSRH